jgi:poly-beta-1,6-N-acetyl-D-glucosamine synthase
MEQKRKLALLVPAWNEATVISHTIESLLVHSDKCDVYVVSDGSKDNTVEVALRYTENVLDLQPNKGKAGAMNACIEHFDLANRYEYIMPMDADTIVTPEFISAAMPLMENDLEKKNACVVGKVIGKSHSWITLYRLWEYEIAQSIHKTAQSLENAIIVCPGCSTIYRADIFNTVKIPTGTLTEDMDFTFMIHRNGLGRIVYTDKAVVVTQDPGTLKDFCKQINRWYTGFWQCVLKHNIPWGGQTLDGEVALLACEGLFNGLLSVVFLIYIPIALFLRIELFFVAVSLDFFLFLLPTMVYASYRHNAWKMLHYIVQFYFMRVLSAILFLKSFIKVVFSADGKMGWNKVTRYEVTSA